MEKPRLFLVNKSEDISSSEAIPKQKIKEKYWQMFEYFASEIDDENAEEEYFVNLANFSASIKILDPLMFKRENIFNEKMKSYFPGCFDSLLEGGKTKKLAALLVNFKISDPRDFDLKRERGTLGKILRENWPRFIDFFQDALLKNYYMDAAFIVAKLALIDREKFMSEGLVNDNFWEKIKDGMEWAQERLEKGGNYNYIVQFFADLKILSPEKFEQMGFEKYAAGIKKTIQGYFNSNYPDDVRIGAWMSANLKIIESKDIQNFFGPKPRGSHLKAVE